MWRRAVSVLQVKYWKMLEFFNADFTCFFVHSPLQTGGRSCLGGSRHRRPRPRSGNPHHSRPCLMGRCCCCLRRRTCPRGLQRTLGPPRLVGGPRLPGRSDPQWKWERSSAESYPLARRAHRARCWTHVPVRQCCASQPCPDRPFRREKNRRRAQSGFPLPWLGSHHGRGPGQRGAQVDGRGQVHHLRLAQDGQEEALQGDSQLRPCRLARSSTAKNNASADTSFGQ